MKNRTATQGKPFTRCAIYTRKSLDEKLDSEISSIEVQRELGEKFVADRQAEGWICLPERYDDGGYTAGNMNRPGIQRLLTDIKAGLVDVVVLYKFDRLSREDGDFIITLHEIERLGVRVVAITQPTDDTPLGRFLRHNLIGVAMLERAQIIERIRHSMAAGRRRGKWMGGHIPLGYDLAPNRSGAGKLVANDAEADQVRAAFEHYDRTGSLLETARFMNERGWRTKTWFNRKEQECGNLRYDKVRASALLRQRLYRGEIDYKGEIIQAEQPALVPAELWDRVNERLARQRRHRTAAPRAADAEAALLQGMVFCKSCGRSMTHARTGNSTGKRYRYYTCTTAIKGGFDSCPAKSVPAAELEAFVVRQLRSVASDAAFRAQLVERAQAGHEAEKTRLETEARHLQAQGNILERRIRAAEGGMDQALFEEHAALRVRLEEIRSDLAVFPSPPTAEELLAAADRFAPVWGELTMAEQRRLVTLLVEKVVIDGENQRVGVLFLPSGFRRLGQAAPETTV